MRLVRAASSPKGRFTVVLDPEMTGVFSHEAVGHACEADAVVDKESILAGSSGKPIGNKLYPLLMTRLQKTLDNTYMMMRKSRQKQLF